MNRLIARIRDEGGPKVTLLHAAALTLAKSYQRYPELNSKIIGHRIAQLETIDISFPVALKAEQPGGSDMFFAKVNDVDKMTLPEVAVAFADAAKRARHAGTHPVTQWIDRAGRVVPDAVMSLAMNQGWGLFKRINFDRLGMPHHPFGSTTISNIGAVQKIDGVASLSTMALIIPMGYTSSFLLGPTIERPIVEDGEIVARPLVPLTYGIDHRVVDGSGFMRYVDFWAKCFKDPEEYLMRRSVD
jgi:pyruvate/2-oxoglutarate dehydrogenase complex dihydrolipoamide acyltransferase (E2) component